MPRRTSSARCPSSPIPSSTASSDDATNANDEDEASIGLLYVVQPDAQVIVNAQQTSAGARLDAVITTAAMNEVCKSTWCREHGVYPGELEQWRLNAMTALAEPEEARASPQATRQDKKRIKELERELLRKDRALAETAALLVLSKKVAAIFNKGEDE